MPVDAHLDPDDPWADEQGFEAPRAPREPAAEFSFLELPGLQLKRFLAQELRRLAALARPEPPPQPQSDTPKVRPRGWRITMGNPE
jgi:hypothetical protein